MPEEHRHMYELEYPSPEVSSDGASGPTLIVALQGYADAGQAVSASARAAIRRNSRSCAKSTPAMGR